MDTVVVVHESEDLLDVVERLLRKELGTDLSIARFSAYDDAALAAIVDARCRLAVLGAAAPEQSGRAPDNVSHGALKARLAQLAAARADLPFLVLATESDDALCSTVGSNPLGRLALVSPGSDWRASARRCAREAFELQPSEAVDARRTRTILRIVLSNQTQGHWAIERRGDVQDTHVGALQVDPTDFGDLCRMADGLLTQLKHEVEWGLCLPPVANDMYRMIFRHPSNVDLLKAFNEALADPTAAEKIRLVFALPSDSYTIPVEALKRLSLKTSAEEWYALHSAVLRHYEGDGPLEPLFWDRASRRDRIDCLLVCADGSARGMGLEPLEQISLEIDDIHAVLKAQKAAGANIGEIKVLNLGDGADDVPLTQRFASALGERPWKIVHFAGHAIIDGGIDDRTRAGLLVLRPEPDGLFGFPAFARSLPHAQFLFVSSCRSAHQAFLQELIQESVPAVLGYRWPVKDVQARKLAAAFYVALLSPGSNSYRSLGRALCHARKEVFQSYPQDVTWASPVLLAKGRRSAVQALEAGMADLATSSVVT